MNRIFPVFAAVTLVSFCSVAAALPDACGVKVESKAPGFVWVEGRYTSVTGDFDDDGREDTAFFIENPKIEKSRAIAVCLSSRADAVLIKKLYVDESLSVSKKGDSFYNHEIDKEEAYPRDGISVSCCECCGATYLYENGAFRQIIDGD